MAMPTINGREVKVGDRLYSYLFASWGEVIKKNGIVDMDIRYPIRVLFPSIGEETYTSDGRFRLDYRSQDLFWNEVSITPPEPPKKKVKKWQWLYRSEGESVSITPKPYRTFEEASLDNPSLRTRLIGPCKESEVEIEE